MLDNKEYLINYWDEKNNYYNNQNNNNNNNNSMIFNNNKDIDNNNNNSMYAKAQTEARRALNVAKMATKGRSAGRKSPSASSARRERISAPRSTILVKETAQATRRL